MKIKVNILHSNLKVNGNELAFLFPLKFNAKRLRDDYGIIIIYFQEDLSFMNILILAWLVSIKIQKFN